MTRRPIVGAVIGLAVASTAMLAGIASAAEITAISTGSFKEVLGELGPAFEKSTGHKVTAAFAGTDEIVRRLGAGEPLDIVIAPAIWIDDLIKRGLVVADSRADVARSGIGAATRAGAPRIDLGSADGLKKGLLAAKSIVLSAGVSGIYLNRLFQKWGVAGEFEPKITTLPGSDRSGRRAGARRGRDRLLAGVRTVAPVKGITFLGPLPADVQEMTAITAGLGKAAAPPMPPARW